MTLQKEAGLHEYLSKKKKKNTPIKPNIYIQIFETYWSLHFFKEISSENYLFKDQSIFLPRSFFALSQTFNLEYVLILLGKIHHHSWNLKGQVIYNLG